MQVFANLLLLFDLNVPEALCAFLGFLGRRRRVVVSFVRVRFGYAQGKEREGKELEDFRYGRLSRYGREEGVLLQRGSIGGRLEGSEGAFDCHAVRLGNEMTSSADREKGRREGENTSEHIFALPIQDTCPSLQVLAAQPLGHGQSLRIGRAWGNGNLLPRLPLLHLRLSGLLRRLLLLGELLLALMVLERLLLQLVDILVNAQTGLFRIGFNLLPLPGLKLLRGHATFLGFLGNLLLHGGDLLRRWLLVRGWGGCHVERFTLYSVYQCRWLG